MKSAGVATHAVPSDRIDALVDELSAVPVGGNVRGVLDKFDTLDTQPAVDGETLATLNALFAGANDGSLTFADYWQRVNALADKGDAVGKKTLDTLGGVSPTSVRVTFEQLRRGAQLSSLADALDMEFTLVQHFLRNSDFYSGVRAQLVDKDRTPVWQPALMEQVDEATVQSYFVAEEDFDALKLPHSPASKL